jgi:peptidoglycan/xylan/chitin deacetylase (PgdA/CDA1 family)
MRPGRYNVGVLRRVLTAALVLTLALVVLAVLHAARRLEAFRALHAAGPAPVLVYHEIVADPAETGLHNPDVMAVSRFAAQMDELAAGGYRPVELGAFASGRLGARSVLITFDDGYASTYLTAYPILARHGFPATVFLITGLVGRPGYLSWAEVRAMAGLIQFGCHTAALHAEVGGVPLLESTPRQAVLEDLHRCRQAIADHLGRVPAAFAYPFGTVDRRTATLVRLAGFTLAFAGEGVPPTGVPPRLAVPRFPVPPHITPLEFRLFGLGERPGVRGWLGLVGETFAHGWWRLTGHRG